MGPPRIASSTSRGSRPLAAVTARPVAIRRFSPATRTMKNSSRLLAKIARNRARSSSGRSGSRASSSTRSLKASQDSSRSRKRSDGRVGSRPALRRPLTIVDGPPGALPAREPAAGGCWDAGQPPEPLGSWRGSSCRSMLSRFYELSETMTRSNSSRSRADPPPSLTTSAAWAADLERGGRTSTGRPPPGRRTSAVPEVRSSRWSRSRSPQVTGGCGRTSRRCPSG